MMPTDRDHATLRARVQAQIAAQQARIATSQAYRRQRPPRRPLPLALVALLVALTLGGGAFGSPPAAAATWQSAGTLPGDYSPGAGAVLLADGRVLVVSRERAAISTRDADTWTALPDRKYGAGTLLALQDGGALLVGGAPTTFANDPYAPTRQVVRLDPRTGTWVKGNDMPDGRGEHTLTTLRDGTILVVGGSGGSLSPRQPIATLAQVGRYDPAIDAWTALAPLAQARDAAPRWPRTGRRRGHLQDRQLRECRVGPARQRGDLQPRRQHLAGRRAADRRALRPAGERLDERGDGRPGPRRVRHDAPP